jgi:alkylation response protein AidB-like acyl-CoA dehydrogenase
MAAVYTTEATGKACCGVAWMVGGWVCLHEFPVEYFHLHVCAKRIFRGASEIQRLIVTNELKRSILRCGS